MTYNTEQSLIPIAALCLSLAVLSHIRGSNFRNFFLTSSGYFILARGYYWYKGTLDFNSFILATLTFLSPIRNHISASFLNKVDNSELSTLFLNTCEKRMDKQFQIMNDEIPGTCTPLIASSERYS